MTARGRPLAASMALKAASTGPSPSAVRSMLRPWKGVICAESAHLNVDEGGAPETLAGIKLLTVPTPDGKLTPELAARRVVRIGDRWVPWDELGCYRGVVEAVTRAGP